jgi:hypothetical protein
LTHPKAQSLLTPPPVSSFSNVNRILPCLLLLSGLAAAANPDGERFFETKVEPILRDACYKCHSHSSDRIKGGLVLDSNSGLLTGGDSGPSIVPGDPEKSLLIEAVRYENEDLQMPPKGKKLSDEQIAILTDWIKMGAPWPEREGAIAARPKDKITDEDRKWWAFQPLAKAALPPPDPWARNEIDRFILARLQAEGLRPAPQARKEALIRRVYLDLIGLPPTPEEVEAFIADESPDAYARVVDRLLENPRYGERWARHWLDLVRYAESDGYRVDDYRPNAWRYRDYVIRSFNADKPYDRFVQEQIAGDELWPSDTDARTATGYLCHWIYEYNNRDVAGQWSNILNDITDTTADVFMGMGLQCARCHDHKFDPILQKDYYRFQAFFAPILPYAEAPVAAAQEQAEYRARFADWEAKTADLRRQIDELEAPYRKKAADEAIAKFPPETRALIAKPREQRSPYEQQLVALAWRQVEYEWSDRRFPGKVKEPDKSRRSALLAELQKFAADKPKPLPVAPVATDVGPVAPSVTIPKRPQLGEIEPGFLTILGEAPAKIQPAGTLTTGRRAALARWLTSPENPLTTRVIVNRIWQYHFGTGLAVNASDFGKLGAPPSHPELLDWMARWFVEQGWSLKKLHRLMLSSATYQQAATNPMAEKARLTDPENRLLWRGQIRRLDAEQIRDAVLAVTGELKPSQGGPGLDPDKPVRTIYSKVIRNNRDPVLDVFDAPEGFASTAQRNVTTTPTQSLLMINSRWTLARANAFASRLTKSQPSDESALIRDAFRLAFGRNPSPAEIKSAANFIQEQASVARADAAKNVETVPFAYDRMRFRDGQSALLAPGTPQDRLVVPYSPAFPKRDFTIEAFITLKSVYETGSVRTIASQWEGSRGHPGWALGITGKASRHRPQTLVLLLSGDPPWSATDPTEPVFSGLHIDLGKPYYVAASVQLENPSEKGITFYVKDLTNDDEPLQIVHVTHKTTSGIANDSPFVIGARGDDKNHAFDGLIDEVRLSSIPLRLEQLLFNSTGATEHTVGYWKFEADPSPYADSSNRSHDITAPVREGPKQDPRKAAIVDFCHVLLNSNEFLYVE